MLFKIEVLIEALNEYAAESARAEITNGAQDAEDGGYVPTGTFSVSELILVP